MIRFLSSLVVFMLLGGCSSMSVEECKVARWSDVGLRDGLSGQPLSKLQDLSSSCAEAHVAVDTSAYLQGRDQGLTTYCRLDNATRLGLNGQFYSGVCPASIDGEFRRQFNVGRNVYDSRLQLQNLNNRRSELEKKLRDATNDADRKKARDELSDSDSRTRLARDQVQNAEWALDRLR